MIAPRQFYEDNIKSYTAGLQQVRKRLALLATLRLIAFTGLAITAWYYIKSLPDPVLFTIPTRIALLSAFLGFFTAFVALVKLYLRLRDKKALLEQLIFVNTNELNILQNMPNSLPDGKEWLSHVSYLDDLDIFGPRSLFHLLNRTTTSHGKQQLAAMLKNTLLSIPSIQHHQQAIKTIAEQPHVSQLLIARGLLSNEKEGNLHSLTQWLSSPSKLVNNKFLHLFRWILIVYNIGAIYFFLDTNNFLPMVIGIAIAWLVTGRQLGYINEQHLLIGKKQAVLDQYAVVLSAFNTFEAGHASLLQELQTRTVKANKAIGRLAKLSSLFDQRLNLLVNILLNSFLLYDLQNMIALERWKEENRKGFNDWIGAVGDIEYLNSLGTFAFNRPDFTYPLPVAGEQLLIAATTLAHPLIAASERVANDCTLGRDERLALVTGSNMSGKTTFLRTVGVNILLAQCGAPVCAASFSFTPMNLLTSLRVSDSLQEHTSYFMAELKKLQHIVHSLQTGQPALVLIDEILRGTNSEDKTYGSEQFIRKLLRYHSLSLFATHDLSLGSLEQEQPGLISNYCFESVIEKDELHFDYRLQKGIASNRNASFLMKKMEII